MDFQSFGKYLLLRKLATGGMAEIYLARQTGLAGFEKLVVIKRILPELAADAEFVKMFLDEARVAASMSHPNVVQIYDLGKVEKVLYIAMEYIAGQDLRFVIKAANQAGRDIPFEIVARIGASVCEGLQYAHTMKDTRGHPLNLVHRDVTPSNLFVSYEGAVKVLDFGVARAESQVAKTQGGKVKGKFAYMAPEQISNDKIDSRVDLWALGVTLQEALTGTRMFKAENELAMIRGILELPIPKPSDNRPDVPPALEAIVMKALERDREKRYPTARAMQLDLEAWLRTCETPASGTEVGAFLRDLFAEEFIAQEKLIAELPNLSEEELKQQLEDVIGDMPSTSDVWSDPMATPARKQEPVSRPSSAPPVPQSWKPEAAPAVSTPPPAARPVMPFVIGAGVLLLAGAGWVGLELRKSRRAVVVEEPHRTETVKAVAVTGEVSVRSDPPGAFVYFDERLQPDKTPTVVKGAALGKHELRLEFPGRQPRGQPVELSLEHLSEAIALTLPLAEIEAGTVTINTTPPGANVFLDGVKQPTASPLKISEVQSLAAHTLLVEKEGFELTSANVMLKPGEEKTFNFTLSAKPPSKGTPVAPRPVAMGRLSLTSAPAAEIFLGARSLGKSPLSGVALPAGTQTLKLVSEELGLNTEVVVEVPVGGEVTRAVALGKGKLAADVQPWADVYIGNQKLGTTPLAPREVYEGTYIVRLVNNEIGALKTLSVIVKPGQTTVVRQDLAAK